MARDSCYACQLVERQQHTRRMQTRALTQGGETVSTTQSVWPTADARTGSFEGTRWLNANSLRRFVLIRLEDVHGVSGEGLVAEGVQFSDGKAAIHWITGEYRTTTPHDSIESVVGIHGHDGRTQIVWVD